MGSFSHEASCPHAEAWGYTNYVRLRGLNVLQGFEPAQAGLSLCSRDFNRLVRLV
jgi:hypothetical protein